MLEQLQAAGDLEGVQPIQEQPEESEAKLADAGDNALLVCLWVQRGGGARLYIAAGTRSTPTAVSK
jgi:hypothetical protein